MRRGVFALALAATLAGALLAASRLGDGTREVADLTLTRHLPRSYERACRRLAEYAPRALATCPPLVPAGSLEVEIAGPFSGTHRFREWFVMSLASCSLNSYGGRPIHTNGCHWAYELAWSRRTRRVVVQRVMHGNDPANPPAPCRWRRLAGQRVRACRVPPFEEGGGFHGGHIAYLWERSSAAVVLSAHGYPNQARVEAMMTALIRAAGR